MQGHDCQHECCRHYKGSEQPDWHQHWGWSTHVSMSVYRAGKSENHELINSHKDLFAAIFSFSFKFNLQSHF